MGLKMGLKSVFIEEKHDSGKNTVLLNKQINSFSLSLSFSLILWYLV